MISSIGIQKRFLTDLSPLFMYIAGLLHESFLFIITVMIGRCHMKNEVRSKNYKKQPGALLRLLLKNRQLYFRFVQFIILFLRESS